MKRLVKKHPLAIRWFHWINFPLLTLMIWSGLMIYWAGSDARFSNGVYRIGWGQTTLFHFFPDAFWRALGLQYQLARGMAWHFFFVWFFAINGFLYVIYLLVSGEWRFLVPQRHALVGAFQVLLHDLHLRKTLPPFLKYNPAQRIAYTLIILMGGASLVTGLAIYRPVQLGWLTALLGGYQWARWEHFWLTMGFVLFFVIHVIQVVRAGWNNFRSMVAGVEIEETKPDHDKP
ncbi:cytochrome b/b6 domain-containing protein [Pedosphaera parvula]|uniref:Thiosulfate reductase cytochrome b subunit (Membrane anchoring protein)-like protein n=1 Tax=Pedosphaera parvula (strain Ellin514) TaxID=320771 RepID=B9XKI3_PEDPL|nr:cytochrome b/b6 domain-containing protein [Pedosphaera parvula]EEF59653.1 thiosulfate reductase cytochrome b subunit (membrane anchoring protein)-like protein [Pedosphaera parvula Ellin514]